MSLPNPGDFLTRGNGPVLQQVVVIPIFWGQAWATSTTPSVQDVVGGIANILGGPYLSGLAQYGVQGGELHLVSIASNHSPDPPNPFALDDIASMIGKLLDAGLVPQPDDWQPPFVPLYMAFMPPGTNDNAGAHSVFLHNSKTVFFAYTGFADLNRMTETFSHELVEACTDPDGTNGWRFNIKFGNAGEIGDVCQGVPTPLNGTVVTPYWSQQNRACTIPTLTVTMPPRWWGMGGSIRDVLGWGMSANGQLHAFSKGIHGAVWRMDQTGDPAWSGWSSLGGQIKDALAVERNSDGRLGVFARGMDNAVWHIWQTTPNGQWSTWFSLGGQITNLLTVGANQNGALEVFGQGADGALWHIKQTAALDWGQVWKSLGGSIKDVLAVAQNGDGRLEVFAKGLHNALWHIWQTSPNGPWASWHTLGGQIGNLLTVGANQNGVLEVFGQGTDGALWHIKQTAVLD